MSIVPVVHPPSSTAPVASDLPVPSEADVAALVAAFDAVHALLGAAATPLTAQERRRVLRARRGSESTVGLMVHLAKQYALSLPTADPDRIAQRALLVQRLQPLETKLRVVTGLVSDTIASSKGETWQGATSLYTALLRASRNDATLQKALAPAVAFFRKAKPSASTAPPASDAK